MSSLRVGSNFKWLWSFAFPLYFLVLPSASGAAPPGVFMQSAWCLTLAMQTDSSTPSAEPEPSVLPNAADSCAPPATNQADSAPAATPLPTPPEPTPTLQPTVPTPPLDLLPADHPIQRGEWTFRDIVKQVLPSVVTVKVMSGPVEPILPLPTTSDNPGMRQSFGSGVIVRSNGVVLTNYHVVVQAVEVRVTLQDLREYRVVEIFSDPKTDLAVLLVELPKDTILPTVSLSELDDVEIGDWVLAMGAPHGLPGTVTAGIISAKGRQPFTAFGPLYQDFLQTDAAINQGNSGGPLVDRDGQVIGINTALRSNDGHYEGIGFAIPASIVRKVLEQLLTTGQVKRGYLGIRIVPVEPAALTARQIANAVEVVRVAGPDTPAARAGLKEGDWLLRVHGTPVRTPQELQWLIGTIPAGTTIQMEVLRGPERLTLAVELAEQPGELGTNPIPALPPSHRPELFDRTE